MSTFIKWYPELKNAFKYLVPVAIGLNKTQPYAESNVVFPNFSSYIAGQTNATTGPAQSSSASGSAGASGTARPSGSASASSGTAGNAANPSSTTSRAAAGAAMDLGLMRGAAGAAVSLVMVALGAVLVL